MRTKLLCFFLLLSIFPGWNLKPCFAVSENAGQWSFGDPANYISDEGVEVAVGAASLEQNSSPVAWYNASWIYRKPIIIDNSAGAGLSGYQVKISLSSLNFNYAKSKPAGADVRLTDSDGVSLLDYWIETWNNNGNSVIWTKIPSITAGSSKTIYLYYGNPGASSAANGKDTFDFFDDFSSPNVYQGYYALSEPSLGLEIDQPWEQASGIGPHTMSIIEWNHDGYRYWAYYGLAGGQGIGLARSNDLVNWTKYENNPL
ncbi:MAG: DUF2341 domain-containing protein, partial [Patescibacteria group bacterium]|nr:DUF2341 domain-containing protein [Patescibacteria group bacterium]